MGSDEVLVARRMPRVLIPHKGAPGNASIAARSLPISLRMSRRAASRRSAAESRETCPSCGLEVSVLATGHCLYCLQPLSTDVESVETGKILRLSEFERARGQVKRSRGRKAVRSARTGFVGALVGAILVGLFYL